MKAPEAMLYFNLPIIWIILAMKNALLANDGIGTASAVVTTLY